MKLSLALGYNNGEGIRLPFEKSFLMASLREVARSAGVDPSIVSRLLNDDPTLVIKPETRDRIVAAVRELDYRPNFLARGLRRRSTDTIAMLIPDISNPVYAEIIRGAEHAAARSGYYILLANTDETELREAGYVRLLTEGRVDGVVLASSVADDEVVERLEASGFPYVLVNRRSRTARRYVILDDSGGAELAVRHLLQQGRQRIAHLAGPLYAGTALERLQGYRQALQKASAPFDSALVVECPFTEEGGVAGMRRLLKVDPLPDAVFAANVRLAFGALSVILEAGLRVPEDVSLVAFHDHPLAGLVRPGLTTVRMPLYQMGYEAVQMLVRVLRREPGPEQIVLGGAELVQRQSA